MSHLSATLGLWFMFAIMTAVVLWAAVHPMLLKKMRWEIGQCVVANIFRESWESVYVLRVEEVGQRSYRVAAWNSAAGTWGTEPQSISFHEQEAYRVLSTCPDQAGIERKPLRKKQWMFSAAGDWSTPQLGGNTWT